MGRNVTEEMIQTTDYDLGDNKADLTIERIATATEQNLVSIG
jgi:hypothetical protein